MGDVHDATYYAKCMVGGIFACGLTHMAVCPLDIVKCRMQVSHFFPRPQSFCLEQNPFKTGTLIAISSFRLTPACTLALATASERSTLPKV